MPLSKEQLKKIKQIKNIAGIPAVSIASVSSDGTISSMELNTTDAESSTKGPGASKNSFGAASLSKPVFAYLVLKLIEANNSDDEKFMSDEENLESEEENLNLGKFNLHEGVTQFDLDTPLCKILPELSDYGNNVEAETITTRMVLSHRTGIPISHQGNRTPEFDFVPGTNYGYAGFPYLYLQIVIEKLTGKSLQKLAKKYVFDRLEMNDSTFLRPEYSTTTTVQDDESTVHELFPIDTEKFEAISANSLRTTASDYARFISAWMNDEKLLYAFESEFSMTTDDQWANDLELSKEVLENISWGLGWGLQKDSQGHVISAFHSGDMHEWRAFVAMDLINKTAVVYFSNSEDGLVLADQIASPIVQVDDALKYISEKYGFATKHEPGWREMQEERIAIIKKYLNARCEARAATKSEPRGKAEKRSKPTTKFKQPLRITTTGSSSKLSCPNKATERERHTERTATVTTTVSPNNGHTPKNIASSPSATPLIFSSS